MPVRDRYSSQRTALLLYTVAYHAGGAPAGARPPGNGIAWGHQGWASVNRTG